MLYVAAGLAAIVAGGLLTYLFPKKNSFGPWVATVGVGAGICLILPAAWSGVLGYPVAACRLAGLFWQMDPLPAFFVFVIALISLLASVYAQGYLRRYQREGSDIRINLLLFNLLIASMLLIPLAGETLSFLLIWEVMTLSSFLLVIYEHRQSENLRAGIKYLVAMHVGFVFILAGFALAAAAAGSTSFARIAAYFAAHRLEGLPSIILLLLGFSFKAGFLPFHFWLPEAHPAAPTHVSAVMSGVMIKTGIFGIFLTIRLFSLQSLPLAIIVLAVAGLSGLYGVIYALSQHDLKKLLAYHSVENIGIIGLGIGVGLLGQATGLPVMTFLGFAGALLHVAGHAIFKSLLFFATGSVYQYTHTRDLELLGGLHRKLPWTTASFLAGSMAISGLPPFNGFISEYLIYMALFTGVGAATTLTSLLGLAGIISLVLIGGLALACFAKAFGLVFLGEPRRPLPAASPRESLPMVLPMLILSLSALLIGVFPRWPLRLLIAPVQDLTGLWPSAIAPLAAQAEGITRYCLGFLGLVMLMALLRWALLRRRKIASATTWGCGYQAVTPRMQYTGSSFAAGILSLGGRLIQRDRHLQKPQGLFPAGGSYRSHNRDLLETSLLKPFLSALTRVLGWFRWIQHGDLQHYVLYGLAFLGLIILLALGG